MTELTRRQLDAYLDGTMPAAERVQFEGRVKSDVELRTAVETQRAIDTSLRRLFPVAVNGAADAVLKQAQLQTDASEVVVRPRRPEPQIKEKPTSNWLRRLAVAAVVLGGAYGVWSTYTFYFPPKQRFTGGQAGGVQPLRLDEYYDKKVQGGYQPYWVCENDAQFADTFRTRFGQGLLLPQLPANITCAGLDYCYTISEDTTAVMLTIDATNVIVLVDRAEVINRCQYEMDLNTFEKILGKLRLVELTPLEQPRALDLFINPDAPSS